MVRPCLRAQLCLEGNDRLRASSSPTHFSPASQRSPIKCLLLVPPRSHPHSHTHIHTQAGNQLQVLQNGLDTEAAVGLSQLPIRMQLLCISARHGGHFSFLCTHKHTHTARKVRVIKAVHQGRIVFTVTLCGLSQ